MIQIEDVKESHSVVFDHNNPNWSFQPEYNLLFIRAQQNYFNDRLRVRGYVFLNEIFDALDVERTRDGQLVGWVFNDSGRGYIDFGLFSNPQDTEQDPDFTPKFQAYITGADDALTLDFNVDGVILEHLK